MGLMKSLATQFLLVDPGEWVCRLFSVNSFISFAAWILTCCSHPHVPPPAGHLREALYLSSTSGLNHKLALLPPLQVYSCSCTLCLHSLHNLFSGGNPGCHWYFLSPPSLDCYPWALLTSLQMPFHPLPWMRPFTSARCIFPVSFLFSQFFTWE